VELDDRETSQGANDSPRRNAAAGLHDRAIAGHEQDVDWKPHEEGVDHVRRRDDQRVAGSQAVTAEKSTVTRGGVEGGFQVRRDGKARAHVAHQIRAPHATGQRKEKMLLQGRPATMIGTRIRYFTFCPFNTAGLNFQALAAATSIRS
jgi:hypothetical protein